MLKFETVDFDSQLARSIAKTGTHFAEVGECLAVAERIEDGNVDSWRQEWWELATHLHRDAEQAARKGHSLSARNLYFRSCEYYRQSTFFHRVDLDCDPLQSGWAGLQETFRAGMAQSSYGCEAVEIPFEESHMHGYVLWSKSGAAPTVLAPGGYDSTAEEFVSLVGWAALERGYNVLLVDGPGQGGTLYDPAVRLFMRPDYEVPIAAAVDFAVSRPEFDPERIALVGASFGGYLAARAAGVEHRIAGLVLDPGQYDIGSGMSQRLPAELLARVDEDDPEVVAAFETLRTTPAGKLMFEPRMAAHGVSTVREYVAHLLQFTCEGLAEQISCPTLICDNETDVVSTKQGQVLASHMTCPHEFIRFTDAEGAGGHCEGMGREIFLQRSFDWLDETLR